MMATALAGGPYLLDATGTAMLRGGVADIALEPLAVSDRITFAGDSITRNGYVGVFRDAMQEKLPELNLEVIESGVGGNTVSLLWQRFDDLLAQQPTTIVIYIGINDVWRAGTTTAAYEMRLKFMVDAARAAGVRPVLCTLSVIGENLDDSNAYNAKLDEFSDVVRRVGLETTAQVIDLRAAMVAHLTENNLDNLAAGILTQDGVHLNETGVQFVGQQMLDAFVDFENPSIASFDWDLDGDGTFETAGRRVQYDSAVTPMGNSRMATVRVTDAAGEATAQAAIHDPPRLALGSPVTYTEGKNPLLIAPSATLSDSDSLHYEGGTLAVTIAPAVDPLRDSLRVAPGGDIGKVGNQVFYQGRPLGTVFGGASGKQLVVLLTSEATPAAVQALMQNVKFLTVGADPITTTRTVRFTLTEASGIKGTATQSVAVVDVPTAAFLAAVDELENNNRKNRG